MSCFSGGTSSLLLSSNTEYLRFIVLNGLESLLDLEMSQSGPSCVSAQLFGVFYVNSKHGGSQS